jgi:DNA invertase Pin-like site-specific DNA recombinase
VSRLDRLARSVLDLAKIVERLQRKGVALHVIDQGLNTETSEGKLTFHILSAMAEFEMAIRASRQAEGVAMAHQKGVKFGRRRALNPEQVNTLRRLRAEEGFTFGQLQDKYQVSRSTVLRALQMAAAA